MKTFFSALLIWLLFSGSSNAQDLIYRSAFENNEINQLSLGFLPADVQVDKQVIRYPAPDAPLTDSQTQLFSGTDVDVVKHIWQVLDSQTHEQVYITTEKSPVFTCPKNSRSAYDVRLTIESISEYSIFRQRRLITCTLPRSDAGRTVHSINLNTDTTYYPNGTIAGVVVQPGDLVRLAGTAPNDRNLQFIDFKGSPEQPIHFINEGLVQHADAGKLFHLIDVEHIIIDGKGADDHDYGIQLTSSNGTGETAVFVRGKTTDVEIYGVQVDLDSGSGFEINTLGTEDYNRSNWQHNNLRLHHNRVLSAHNEGFYVGYTHDNNSTPPSFWAAYQIHHGHVYRNHIENTGWDGLQVANMVVGMEVHHNYASNTGLRGSAGQESSYQHNAGNEGHVYHNTFLGGVGVNIQQGETGGQSIFYGNVIAGDLTGDHIHAVYAFGGPSSDDSYHFYANTLVSPGHGLRLNSQRGELNALTLSHNLVILGTSNDDLFRFASAPPTNTLIITTPNLTRPQNNQSDLCFNDITVDDYRLACAQSAALATATVSLQSVLPASATPFKEHTDLSGRVRPEGYSYGAYWSVYNQ